MAATLHLSGMCQFPGMSGKVLGNVRGESRSTSTRLVIVYKKLDWLCAQVFHYLTGVRPPIFPFTSASFATAKRFNQFL